MSERAADAALAARDPALAHLDLVLDEQRFGALLAAERPELGLRGAEATYVRYKPGTACIVQYRLTLADRELGAYVRLQRPDDAAKLGKHASRMRAPSPLGRGALALPGLTAALYPRPNDRLIAALPRLGDPARRARLLRRALPDRPDLWSADLRPLRWKPERRFVGALVCDGAPSAVVKAFGAGIEHPFDAAKLLGGGEDPRTPRRLGHLRGRGILVSAWMDGVGLAHAPSREGAAAAGAALQALHARTPVALPCHARGDELARLRRSLATVARLVPGAGGDAERLVRALGAELPFGASVVTHGDFSADQVLIGRGGAAALLDLDEAVLSDPLRDLGSFLAAAERDVVLGRLDRHAADALRAGLLDGYGAAPADEVRAWTAAGLLHVAPEPFRLRCAAWPELVGALVVRAREIHAGR